MYIFLKLPSSFRPVVLALTVNLPQNYLLCVRTRNRRFGVIASTPLANRVGVYGLILYATRSLCALGILALLLGPTHYMLWGILLVAQLVLFSSWGFYDVAMLVISCDTSGGISFAMNPHCRVS